MPNHLHAIIWLESGCSKPLGSLIGAYKTVSSKRINELLGHGYDEQRQWVINNILLDGSPARSQASYRKLPFEVKRRARLWGDRVADCLDLVDETESIEVLKTAIVSLKALLFTAPSDCDAQGLRSVIRHLRMVLSHHTVEGAWGLVR